jgi:hypothetical protein
MLREYYVMYGVRYYSRFNVTAVGLGTYYPLIRGQHFTYEYIYISMACQGTTLQRPVKASRESGALFCEEINNISLLIDSIRQTSRNES